MSKLQPAIPPVVESLSISAAGGVCQGHGFGRHPGLSRQVDRLPPALAALLIQVIASALTLALHCVATIVALDAPWTFWALVQAGVAVLLATACGQPQWWVIMHSLFAPAALLLDQVGPPPWVYLSGAFVLALTNSNSLRDRVPLFLSSGAACDRLLALLPPDTPIRFVDIGCGFGGVVSAVGRERPTLDCLGLETAWLPYLVCRLRCAASPNHVRVSRSDLWRHSLGDADVVYAYLSPVPMARLWRKLAAEMRPGALFISNSFAVPGVQPDSAIPIDDATGSVLYVYRIGGAASVPTAAAARGGAASVPTVAVAWDAVAAVTTAASAARS